MKYIVYIFLLFPILVTAQTYKYIGIENGLSNRRIFNIQKDDQGYMWFLTNEGMDRYNGKDIKHYKLNKDNNSVASQIHLGWLYATPEAGLWVIGRKGRLFQYEKQYDRFTIGYKLPDISKTISYGYVDHNNNIWLCCNDSIVLYNIKNAHTFQFPNILHSNITAIEQIDDNHFFIATETGVRYAKLKNGALQIIPTETLDYFHTQVSVLYFQQQQKKLYIGSFERGIFVYDMLSQEIIRPEADLSDVNITRIRPLNETELLVATEGMGVYKLDMNKCILERYISANYQSYNEMNGDNINDVFVDESKRIWLANYPTGITVIDYRYENYHWMKHSMGNKQSIVNDQVHAVIEDSDGDLWFGTSNGISLYNSGTGEWHSFLSSFNHQLKDKNHIFITLCEVSPGIIWAGGYTSGIYKINKADLSVEYFSPYLLSHINMRPDKYIRDMIKDSKGHIWSGGYYNLKCFDLATNSVRLYPGVSSITAIAEKDSHNMWIGTAMGLYLLNRDSGKYEYIKLEAGSTYINTLYQADNGLLYVGTNGAGVFIYDAQNKKFEHYIAKNSALVSNSIFTILPEVDGRIMMSTENGVTSFHTKEKIFHNWTKGEGLLPAYFNASSGVLRKNKNFVFGSTDGAIELPQNVKFPDYVYTKMIFSDLNISYQPVYPGEEDSPLEKSINDTDVLELKYNQNTFSFRVSTINYDSPGNALYAWKLDGFFEKVSYRGIEHLLRRRYFILLFLLFGDILFQVQCNLIYLLRNQRSRPFHVEKRRFNELRRLFQRIEPAFQVGATVLLDMLRHAVALRDQCTAELGHQFLSGILRRTESRRFKPVKHAFRTCRMRHLVEKRPVERLPVLELFLLGHDDFVLRDRVVGVVLVHRLYGANPEVILYHRIDGSETELLAVPYFRLPVLLLQLFPHLRTGLLQVGLRYIEHTEYLHLRIDIILFFLFVGEFLVVIVLDFLLRLLVNTGKRGQHDRERLLSAQHRHTGQLLSVLVGLVEPLHAVEGAETRNFVSLILAVQKQ